MNEGKIFIVCGPSGCGKGTVLSKVFQKLDSYYFSVSATTRAPRPGEKNGVHYLFLSREKFEEMLCHDAFLEYAEYVGNYYGTPKQPVLEHVAMGQDVFLEIEIQGFEQVKEKLPQAISVLIVPPSIEELENRLRGRSTETEEKLQGRLKKAAEELSHASRFDIIVVNDDADRAANEILSFIQSYHH